MNNNENVKIVGKDVSMSKLPNIEITTFDGKYFTKFKPFIDLFNALIQSQYPHA